MPDVGFEINTTTVTIFICTILFILVMEITGRKN